MNSLNTMNSLIARTLLLLFLIASVLCSPVRAADFWQERSKSALAGRIGHTAVWTGTEMIVWGGSTTNVDFNDGGRYNPATNSWTAVTTTGAPAARRGHRAVWTGTEMIVWGGYNYNNETYLKSGGRYNPASNSWTAVSTTGAPAARHDETAVWTGSEMIVWGGSNGGNFFNTGGRYNPAGNSWTTVSTSGAPAARHVHTAVWTGSEMIVWGGESPGYSPLNTGGRYNPASNGWTAVNTTGAPAARDQHTAVWTGTEMIVWGGRPAVNTGGRYNPAGNRWTATSTTGAPTPGGGGFRAVWTGSEMIVWGAWAENNIYHAIGGHYDPAGNGWTAVTTTGAPAVRGTHTAVWTGSEMIVWGDASGSFLGNVTFSYTPDAFRITGLVLDSGTLILSFPSRIGLTYALWRSDTLAGGTWTPSGLPSIPGDGTDKFFSVGAPVAGIPKRFYRVQAGP